MQRKGVEVKFILGLKKLKKTRTRNKIKRQRGRRE
jgi:hypothetical protein